MHKFNEEGIERIDDELSDKTGDIETILDVKDEPRALKRLQDIRRRGRRYGL